MAKKRSLGIWSPSKIKITGGTYFYPEFLKDPKDGKLKATGSVYIYPEATGKISIDLQKALQKLVENAVK